MKKLKHSELYAALLAIMLIGAMHISLAALSATKIIPSSGLIYFPSDMALHTEGKYIKDELNNTVLLRGVNRPSGFTASCTGNWFENGDWTWGRAYTQWTETGLRDRLQQIKDSNFNVIRLILIVDWWLNDKHTNLNNQNTNIGCRQALDNTVRVAEEYGIYCVLTPYMSEASQADHAMPFPSNTLPDAQSFVDFWAEMANAFKYYPNAIFELWNEPAGNAETILNTFRDTITAMRNTGADNLIIVQLGYGGSFSFVTDPRINGTNIVYSNHIYRFPAGATLPTSVYTYDAIEDYLLNYWQYSAAIYDYPCWIGEIGAWQAYGSQETQYWNNTLTLLNEWEIGYAAWEWDQLGTGWDLQIDRSSAPYPPNGNGQILINSIQ